jgi:aminobenzoyl-glutamate utilization protein A
MAMDSDIIKLAQAVKEKTVARRRDFHKHAEAAWTEFRTASVVAKTLEDLGYQVLTGDETVEATAMMGVPSAAELGRHFQRALEQGAHAAWAERCGAERPAWLGSCDSEAGADGRAAGGYGRERSGGGGRREAPTVP